MNRRKRKESGVENPASPTRVSPRKAGNKAGNQDTPATATSEELQVTPRKTYREPSRSKRAKPSASETVKNTLDKGYTSDGMSFESLADEDMLPDINISSPFKGRKHIKDDIVWAPYKKMYWPALVTSVKWPLVCYLFVNERSNVVYRTHAKRLLSFDNAAGNLELKEKGEKADLDFAAAYELVIKYLCKRKQNANINARRFLTKSDENDKVRQAKDCLFRLTGVCDANIFPSVGNSDDADIDAEEEVIDVAEDEENEACNEDDMYYEEDSNDRPQQSAEERAKVEEILKDLETVPKNMTVTPKQCDKMKEEAKQLLEIIQSKDCFDHLMQIRNGCIQSSRHKKFYNDEVVHGGLGPFTLFKDLTSQLLSVLDNHCDEYDEPEYKHNVMLAEAIIYAITKVKDCSKLSAKKHFQSMSKKVGVRDIPITQ